jgi:4'-phosphopantetheinyl transferase EntD
MDALLRSLFDAPVTVCSVTASEPLDPLLPDEQAAIGPRWAEKRVWEYRAGRHCARRALAALDPAIVPPSGLLADQDRVPRWPDGVLGSITHTGRGESMFAACVVARGVRGVGLDAELHGPLAQELRKHVLIPSEELELESLAANEEEELGRLALLVFSAKEAFYKCQYPLTRTFLGFHEVSVTLRAAPEDGNRGRFEARLLRPAGPLPMGTVVHGRFTRSEALVLTAAHLP